MKLINRCLDILENTLGYGEGCSGKAESCVDNRCRGRISDTRKGGSLEGGSRQEQSADTKNGHGKEVHYQHRGARSQARQQRDGTFTVPATQAQVVKASLLHLLMRPVSSVAEDLYMAGVTRGTRNTEDTRQRSGGQKGSGIGCSKYCLCIGLDLLNTRCNQGDPFEKGQGSRQGGNLM